MNKRQLLPQSILIAVISLIVPAWTFAQTAKPAAPKGFQRVTSVEGITEYRLPNGLTVLLFPDPSKPTMTVNVTYMVGSRHEDYGETGMAHLLEHLVFKGTPKHPNIPQELTAHGARPNGSTWYDRTNYFETFAATDENLEWALDLEADRMINSFIAKKDLDSEMTVVRNEFESGENDPAAVLEERAVATAFLWHNYGKSTIGARADLENVPIDRLQAFYRKYYQPDNAMLLVAGRIDEAKTLRLIDKYFSPIPKPTRHLQKTYTLDPVQDGERSVTLRRVGDIQALTTVYHVPSGSHTDFAAVDLISLILGDVPSGRLHKALVETKKATSVTGYNYQLREPGVLIFRAELRQDQPIDPAREGLVDIVEGFTKNPPTSEEVERARGTLLKAIELNLNRSDRIRLELSEWASMGDWRLLFLHRDRIRKVSLDDVKRVAAAYLKPSNRTLATFVPTPKPDRAEIPPVPDVASMLKGYKGDPPIAMGEAFDPTPVVIEARTRRTSLANGMSVALLPKKTRGETVVAAMTLRFGDEHSLMNRTTDATLAAGMLMRGTKKHTRQQLKDEFDKLKARVVVTGGPTQANISVETTRPNLPKALQLLAEVLREPAFPSDEFEQLRQQQLADVEESRSDPQSVAFTAFSRHMNPYPKGDVRYVTSHEEDVESLKATKLEEIKRFYSDFYGASNAQLALVGDFDEKAVRKQLDELFGGWKNPRKFARVPTLFNDVVVSSKSLEVPDKANAYFVAGLNLKLRDDDPDYPALLLGNYMLGGGFLNSRLATRIRQKEGLSYGVGSRLAASPLDAAGTFMTFAIYAPENATKLEAAFREEIDRMLQQGFTAEEVDQAKSGFLQGQQVSRAQDAELARKLASYLFYPRTVAWDEELERKIAALTPAQINAAMKRHVDPAKITIFKAGDFARVVGGPVK